MQANSSDPFFDDWQTLIDDPIREWSRVAKVAGARAQSLVDDFPLAAAMVRTKLKLTIGPRGLRFNSQFIANPDAPATPADIATRKKINRIVQHYGRKVDAGEVLSRTEFDKQIDWNATVYGDGFAIRVWQGDRTPSTRWRVIHPLRVKNPKGQGNSEKFQDGIEFDSYGRRCAIWVDKSRYSPGGMLCTGIEPVRIPWFHDDGTPNAVHHVFYRRPGSVRGLTGFAPLILPMRLLQMVDVTFVAGKRVQMSHPMTLEVPDLEKAKQQYRGTRFEHLLLGPGAKATFNPARFDGEDYAAFEDAQARGLSASWGIPYELVLGDHSSKSGAAARSLWQQTAEESEGFQAFYADNAQRPRDETSLREAVARDAITGLTDDWSQNMEGDYQGPPPINPDPLKEAEAAAAWIKNGMSKTSAFAMAGYNYDDEREQREQDDALDGEPDDATDAEDSLPKDEDGTAEQTDAADPVPVNPAVDPKEKPTVQRAAEGAVLASGHQGQALAPNFHVNIHPTIQMPHGAPPVVNVAAPAVTIEPAQVNVAAPTVINKVEAPIVNVAAPTVNVAAAEPAPPAPITVNVAAPEVTVENTVEVPARTIIAKPNSDGSVTMTPQG